MFEVPDAPVVYHEDSEAVIVTIHQKSFRDLQSHKLWHFTELFILNHYVLVLFKGSITLEKSDVNGLLSVDFVTVLAKCLP